MTTHAEGLWTATLCGNGKAEDTVPASAPYLAKVTCPDCVRIMLDDSRRRAEFIKPWLRPNYHELLEGIAFAMGCDG